MNKENSLIIELFAEYMGALAKWENGIHERLETAEEQGREGEEGRTIMAEYEALLRRYCTDCLINDPDRRKIDLHYRRPSPYGFTEVESVENKGEWAEIMCRDKRKIEFGEYYRYYLLKTDAGWRVDRREYVPGDGTRAVTITI